MGATILKDTVTDNPSSATWRAAMIDAVAGMLEPIVDAGVVPAEHVADTPGRVVRAFQELFSGVSQDPASVLQVTFSEAIYDQMIVVADIDFVSVCEHHLLPFFGMVHFGYLPNKRVVGLSKIPRLVEILSRRPQIQEALTQQIADAFQENVQPHGCGVLIEAWHSCVAIRGVRKPQTRMITTALKGVFRQGDVKAEFLAAARSRRSA